MSQLIEKELSYRVMELCYRVHNHMGAGLLESAYEAAMAVELEYSGIAFEKEKEYPVYYRNQLISKYYADLVVDNRIIPELKAVKKFDGSMEAQIINYLKISGIKVGYLINFRNEKVESKRYINWG